MFRHTNELIMYNRVREDSILGNMSSLTFITDHEDEAYTRSKLVRDVYDEVHKLLEIATIYGFEGNLWKCYVAFLLAMDENPYSVLCETVGGAENASVNGIVRSDMEHFYHLFHYDFADMERTLGIDCFSVLSDFCSMAKAENTCNKCLRERVLEFTGELDKAENPDDFFAVVTHFYKKYGVGKFGLNKAFRLSSSADKTVLEPITQTSDMTFDSLVGYESQKEMLMSNTEAFLNGKNANNCLLYGDGGTGKSSCIKALLNKYYPKGLRLIELYKHQVKMLHEIIGMIKNRNYKFIIYMDDLSFEDFETDYKYLKAVIEGGIEIKPDNVLIYATSNRRHLIRESFSDRNDMDDIRRSDTMQEKLSLAARFGLTIAFFKPEKKLFDEIVIELAKRAGVEMSKEELLAAANVWSIRNGGYSGRVAEQFIKGLHLNA